MEPHDSNSEDKGKGLQAFNPEFIKTHPVDRPRQPPFYRRRWFIVTGLIIGAIVAVAAFWDNITSALVNTLQLRERYRPAHPIVWTPPELPKGCKDIHLCFAEGITISGPVSEFANDWVTPVRIAVVHPNTNGIQVKLRIKDNRLYVQAPLPLELGTNQIEVLMNNEVDCVLPPGWDKNFNDGAFEIVDDQNLPILQVVYKRPNDIIVRGVFITENSAFFAFGRTAIFAGVPHPPLETIKDRKALFKYPASLHRGELTQ